MPIYEYQCERCHFELEKLQKISDAPLTCCPQCQHDTLRKKVSAAGFQLKGTGWYVTDFKDKKATTNATSSADTNKSGAKSSADSGAKTSSGEAQ